MSESSTLESIRHVSLDLPCESLLRQRQQHHLDFIPAGLIGVMGGSPALMALWSAGSPVLGLLAVATTLVVVVLATTYATIRGRQVRRYRKVLRQIRRVKRQCDEFNAVLFALQHYATRPDSGKPPQPLVDMLCQTRTEIMTAVQQCAAEYRRREQELALADMADSLRPLGRQQRNRMIEAVGTAYAADEKLAATQRQLQESTCDAEAMLRRLQQETESAVKR